MRHTLESVALPGTVTTRCECTRLNQLVLSLVATPGTVTTRCEPLTLANIEASTLASTRAMRELLHLR